MKIWVDGSGWNGKEAKCCYVTEQGDIKIFQTGDKKTNNEMEYQGMIEALIIADDGDEILSDSSLVVGQLTKGWKVRVEHLLTLNLKAQGLLKRKKVIIKWIRRNENKAGHILEFKYKNKNKKGGTDGDKNFSGDKRSERGGSSEDNGTN
jgi:ribonuclease HI